ncbi:division/cell wall cluster transcriptional repressor MraZ [Zoogloea sp.]|uniref:division/cell wall cluster transcriptional repressor MraZ n=1 Tax=Zoogloea sp. TaxID=49181 RepID=UPI0035B19095|nr:division/cell wall cluster transcriptional repressor MraZ [Rhodocyclales bacterium]
MFQGAAALTLDAKGRLAMPTRHRNMLQDLAGNALVLTAHPHRCLLIYPAPAWVPIRDKVLAGSSLEQHSALLKRLLVGFARDETLDAAGRVLIAPELRTFAQLEKQVFLVGQGDHFELWSDAGWQKQQDAIFALGTQLLPAGWETLPL